MSPRLTLPCCSALLLMTGCASQSSEALRQSFLPATRPFVAPARTAETPAKLNPYLSEAPVVVEPRLSEARTPPRLNAADERLREAEQRFQAGKRLYQLKEMPAARVEFDAAIDLLLEASNLLPIDHSAFERKMEEMIETIHRYDMAGLGGSSAAEEAGFEKAPLEDILEMTFPVDPKLKLRVKEQLHATVSQLPLSMNDQVLGYIQYFSGRGHKTIVAGLQRAGRYRALIQRILDEEGLPQELIHLAQAESGFQPRARSRKAATGMWQFMADTARPYGLKRTAHYDDRLDPEKATRAAARHLRDLYNEFGDWYLAIAAYNCGAGAVEKAVERTGYADFWELRRRRVLPAETTNYVPIILAMTIMEKNAEFYGLTGIVPNAPLEYDRIELASPTHLALVADLTDSPVAELRDLNPALLKGSAPAGYTLHVPKGSAETLMASLQMIPLERRASWRMHKVETGDTLASLGKRYGTTPGKILAANDLDSGVPVTGDMLLIPAVQKETKAVVKSAASRRPALRKTASPRRASALRKGPKVLARTAALTGRAARTKSALNR
jgi:membrane-bound lytic murein transglycosylase D